MHVNNDSRGPSATLGSSSFGKAITGASAGAVVGGFGGVPGAIAGAVIGAIANVVVDLRSSQASEVSKNPPK